MTRQINIYPETHSSEETARNYQRHIELFKPDAILKEATFANKGQQDTAIPLLQEYSSFQDIYQELETEKPEEVLNKPLYTLDDTEFRELVEPLEITMRDISEAEPEQEMLYTLKKAYQANQDKQNNSLRRIAHSMKFMDTELESIETEEDRIEMYRYAAKNIDKLPDDIAIVAGLHQQLKEGETEKLYRYQQQNKDLDILEGLEQMSDETLSQRDENFAKTAKSTIDENDYRTAAIIIGRDHVEGLTEELPPDWTINVFDLSGEPQSWRVNPQDRSIWEKLNGTV